MKNLFTLLFLCSIFAMMMTSCAKEELQELETVTDEAAERVAPQADLVITGLLSSLPNVQGPCPGPPKPYVGCNDAGVSPPFTFKALIRNIGNLDVPANSQVDIRWNLFGGGSTNTTITQAIPAGGGIVVSAGPFTLPCPQGPPPFALVERHFWANIDDIGVIPESNENNNISPRLVMCDDD